MPGQAAGSRGAAALPVAFANLPAVVASALVTRRFKVDFLPGVLAHVADPEIAGRAIETEPKRVAQAIGPDFAAAPRLRVEGIVGRNGVGRRTIIGRCRAQVVGAGRRGRIDVDAQHLAQQRLGRTRGVVATLLKVGRIQGLAAIAGIISVAAVAHADPEMPVGSEMQIAAVVVVEILRNFQQHLFGSGRHRGGGRVRAGEARDARDQVYWSTRIAVVGVLDVQTAIGSVVGMKGNAEKAPFAGRVDGAGDVEKRGNQNLVVTVDDSDPAVALDDEAAAAAVAGMPDADRKVERGAAEGRLQLDVAGRPGLDRRQIQNEKQNAGKESGSHGMNSGSIGPPTSRMVLRKPAPVSIRQARPVDFG